MSLLVICCPKIGLPKDRPPYVAARSMPARRTMAQAVFTLKMNEDVGPIIRATMTRVLAGCLLGLMIGCPIGGVGSVAVTLFRGPGRNEMPPRWYELRVADSSMLLSDADIAALGLENTRALSEPALQSRLRSFANRSTAEALHAMLDQQPENCQILIIPYNPEREPEQSDRMS